MVDHNLTRREREVLRQLADGKTNREIAGALGLSRGTVEQHLARIYSKLGVHSRTAALIHLLNNTPNEHAQPDSE